MDSFQFRYTFYDESDSEFKLETTDDINYPFLSPLDVLFKSGRPIGKLSYLVLQYEENMYAFGTIVYSEGSRFIYYSGLSDLRIYDTLSKKNGVLSHITLEANKDKFHIKFQDNKTRAPTFRSTEIEKDHYYWFSMALTHPKHLKPLKNLTYDFEIPKSAVKKRLSFLNNSYAHITHKILTIPENILYEDEFLDFDFYISNHSILDNKNIKLIPPTKFPPRTQKGKIYTVDLLETDFKFGINISRMRHRDVFKRDLARIYHHGFVREHIKKQNK